MIREFATRDALMRAAAERIANSLKQAISERGGACVALSGGATPEPAYRALAAFPLDWSKVTFALVDERFVPSMHSASNEAMLYRALAPARASGAQVLSMFMPYTTPEVAAKHADAAYAAMHINLAVMGMGEDGHTASWFPEMAGLDDVLDAKNPRTVVAVHAPQAVGAADRLTLTRSAVARADSVLLLVTGAEKRERLDRALSDHDAPVASLFDPPVPAPEVWWAP
jgi:6-phosphogluconolactonase